MPTRAEFEALCDALAKRATAKGMLIETGFAGFRAMVPETNPMLLAFARLAFFAGAEHTFSSMMQMLDPGTEPTDADMERMDKIHQELMRFRAEVEKFNAKGRA